MMHLQISVFLLFVLFTSGHCFSCYSCDSMTGSCADQKVETCYSGNSKCVSTTIVSEFGGLGINEKFKHCAGVCVNMSANVGIVRMSSVCCDTELCNVHDAPDPNSLAPNGKKCYYCDGKSCSNVLRCTGSQDRCYNATGFVNDQFMHVRGCVSKSICDAETLVRDVQSASCCEGNLCNGAESVTQSFLFLCCSLLSFILLH